ncbi:MAG: hypothetical protein MUD15_08975 [Desulfobacterota bacterium]|jgi:hypothetical protein|nr:hypothetical protein [Thermodesulfobacteriota bacterium]
METTFLPLLIIVLGLSVIVSGDLDSVLCLIPLLRGEKTGGEESGRG